MELDTIFFVDNPKKWYTSPAVCGIPPLKELGIPSGLNWSVKAMNTSQTPDQEAARDRRETLGALRRLLLTDRAPQPLGRADGPALHVIEQGNLSERYLAGVLGKSRIPIREALAILRTVGVIHVAGAPKRYEVTLLTPSNVDGVDSLGQNVRCEILSNARSAIARFVEKTTSSTERVQQLTPLQGCLDKAQQFARQGTVQERGEAIIGVTEALAGLGKVAGLPWATGTIRSCLDIIEISTRSQQTRSDPSAPLFEPHSIKRRVDDCRAVFSCLSKQSNSNEDVIDGAQDQFRNYVDYGFEEFRKVAIPQLAVA